MSLFIKDPGWKFEGHDVCKVYINGSVITTRIMMIIVMSMYKDRGKMGKIMSLGKEHIGSHCTFLTTLNLVLFPSKKWFKKYFGKGSFRSCFLSHKSKKLRAGCFQIQLDFLICSNFWTWVLLGGQATHSSLNILRHEEQWGVLKAAS